MSELRQPGGISMKQSTHSALQSNREECPSVCGAESREGRWERPALRRPALCSLARAPNTLQTLHTLCTPCKYCTLYTLYNFTYCEQCPHPTILPSNAAHILQTCTQHSGRCPLAQSRLQNSGITAGQWIITQCDSHCRTV